jgi:RHS repeat-associated protein
LSADKNGNVTRFVHAPMGIHAQEDPIGVWTWAIQDGLQSVRSEASSVLSVLGVRHLDPFGNLFGTQGTMTLPFVFTGEIRDENGLQDHRARQYSSQLGIFPSLDPIEGMTDRPMSLNGYSWVEGNTANRVDPSGKQITSLNFCPGDGGATRCVDVRTQIYNRRRAAQAAFNMARNGENSYAGQVVLYDNNSAIFMSLALAAGGFPMVKDPDDVVDSAEFLTNANRPGWRASFVGNQVSGNTVWNQHNFASVFPSQDDKLIGYLWGTHISGGDRISSRVPRATAYLLPTNYIFPSGDREMRFTDDNLSASRVEYVVDYLLGFVQPGDYVFVNSGPPTHGFMVVGFGPAIKCNSSGLRAPTLAGDTVNVPNLQDSDYLGESGSGLRVPYVTDWGTQRNTARPFYCSRVVDEEHTGQYEFFNHSYWNFIRIPDVTETPCQYDYSPNFSVTPDGRIIERTSG